MRPSHAVIAGVRDTVHPCPPARDDSHPNAPMKLVKKLLLLAVFAVVAIGLAGWFLVPPAAKGAVEQGSRYAFGVPTSLASLGAKVGLSTSGIHVEGYRVASPEGFDGKPLLEVGKLGFGVGTTSLLGEPKVVDELVLEGLELHLVQKGAQSNLLPVLQQMRRLAGTGGATEAPAPGGEAGSPGPRIKVKRVRIAGLAATVDVSGIPGLGDLTQRFELPAYDADWTKLSGEDGVTVAELASKLMQEVTDSALAKADEHLPAAASQVLRASLTGGLTGGVDGALDAARGAAEEAAKKELEGAKEKLKDGVKEFTEKGLESVKEAVGGGVSDLVGEDAKKQLEGALDGALGGVLGNTTGDGASAAGEAPAKVEEAAQEKAAEAVQKGTETVEKAAEKATEGAAEKAVEKTEKALKGVLPGGAKDLLGKKPGG